MPEIIDGKRIASQIRQQLINRVKSLQQKSISPGLATILVGDEPSSLTYLKIKKNACAELGIDYNLFHLPEKAKESELRKLIGQLNQDKKVSGIILQLPLPKNIPLEIIEEILPEKDVDGLTSKNLGELFKIKNFSEVIAKKLLVPATPLGVIKMLQELNIPVAQKNVVVVGRSNLVGKPLAQLFLSLNATVTIAHTQTRNLAELTRQADILAVAIGQAKFITAEMVKDGAVVIDIGTNKTSRGLCGDVDFAGVVKKTSYITSVPGGIGPLTVTMLLHNTILAAEKQNLTP